MNSKGHIGYAKGFEYFKNAAGDVFRADYANPVQTTGPDAGYRSGARFYSTAPAFGLALRAGLLELSDASGNPVRA